MGERVFHVGGPNIPESECIIVGRGGGFTWVYDDLVLLPDGVVRFMNYVTEGDIPIPEDFESVRLLIADEGQQYKSFVEELERIKFSSINLPPPASSMIDYVVQVRKDGGLHAAQWPTSDEDTVPPELFSLMRAVRTFVAEKFREAYGD